MDKLERTKNYLDFKNGVQRILISSDVTSRGIDIQQVSTVINFDVPLSPSTYLHRIGRSGRWGRKGVGITLATHRDMPAIKNVETFYSIKLNELPANWAE
jgi:superfamily II DNA/RNA helicase